MSIYVDVLIFINAVSDYLLLNLSSAITGNKIKTLRLVITAIVASLFSLLIFLPYCGAIGELIIKIISSAIICIIGYGFKSCKIFFKNYFSFLTVSVVFNGIMTAIWVIFKPGGMVLNNSIVYFEISALEMIIFSVLSYLCIRLVLSIIRRVSPYARRCRILLRNEEKIVEVIGLVDTGNSLKDIYFGRQVIIADKSIVKELFGGLSNTNKLLLPYKTVGGTGTVVAFPCKKAYINNYDVGSVLIAEAQEAIDGDFKAIVNPEILNIR